MPVILLSSGDMAFDSFRDFLRTLEQGGDLRRIAGPVATELEITEIADREMKKPDGGQALLFENDRATSIYSYFKAACYFLPLLGGFLADRYFGKYWTIVGFSVPYVLGHFVLGIETHTALFIALALLAGGSGVIKPNISTLLGQTYDQKRPGQERLRSAAFLWFYLAINVGAFLSTLFMPSIRDDWGYQIAFQFPAWLMVGALFVFALGKRIVLAH